MDPTGLVVNLAVALAAALVGALIAARLGQSVVLGYILAGVAIGPFTPGFIGDLHAVEELAEIGIVLLLFTLGVEFSFRDLRRAGRAAFLGGALQVLAITGLGYLIGLGLGWRPIESLFFGAIISISSSAVLGKLLGERGETGAEHGRLSLAWAAVQDLSTLVLVVVLSALAAGGGSLVADLLVGVGKAALFLALLVPLGLRLLPWFFERVAALRSREIFILSVAAVAIGTAYASSFFGLSLALGAFVAGMVVSESDLSHQILGEVLPVRDILAGLFFVAVGMLFDPSFVLQNLPLVILVAALIVLAKGALSVGLAAVFRTPVRTALLTGVLLAQAGEFSFILARLGAGLDAVTPAVFNLVVAGAVVSIVLAPPLFRGAHPLARWAERRLPALGSSRLPALPETDVSLRRHAVICGYGRVGRLIGAALRRRSLPFAVIEQDPRLVRRLRDRGVPAFLGNADNPVLLKTAGVAEARLLIIAIPDAVAGRQIVDYARQANPDLDIVVRAHSAEQMAFLRQRGVGEAVMGELELALEMSRHALRRFGVSAMETLAIVQGLRERAIVDEDAEGLDLPDRVTAQR
jgi:CPA2 family monovalent cation:H+ antiporter-2